MEAGASAGVEFVGNLMRYAEVERRSDGYRLLRLGNCEFEFDAASVVYGGLLPRRMTTIQDAIGDVFKDTEAGQFTFVLPTSIMTSFKTHAAKGIAEGEFRKQIAFETKLMNGGKGEGDLFPGKPYDSEKSNWSTLNVTHLENEVGIRVRQLGSSFPESNSIVLPGSMASMNALQSLVSITGAASGSTLLIGCYDNQTDFILSKMDEDVRIRSWGTQTHADRVYFALESLHHASISISEIDSILVYGHEMDTPLLDSLEAEFGDLVAIFDPAPIVDMDSTRFEKGFPLHAFVPCIGAALR